MAEKIDHTNCIHPRTPAGRRACRNSVRNGAPAPVAPDYIGDHIRATAAKHAIKAKMDRDYDKAEIKMTGPVARRMARHAAKSDRIQPRKSGARVKIDNSGCVQAALHTGTGRCACGWHTDNHCYDDCTAHPVAA